MLKFWQKRSKFWQKRSKFHEKVKFFTWKVKILQKKSKFWRKQSNSGKKKTTIWGQKVKTLTEKSRQHILLTFNAQWRIFTVIPANRIFPLRSSSTDLHTISSCESADDNLREVSSAFEVSLNLTAINYFCTAKVSGVKKQNQNQLQQADWTFKGAFPPQVETQ